MRSGAAARSGAESNGKLGRKGSLVKLRWRGGNANQAEATADPHTGGSHDGLKAGAPAEAFPAQLEKWRKPSGGSGEAAARSSPSRFLPTCCAIPPAAPSPVGPARLGPQEPPRPGAQPRPSHRLPGPLCSERPLSVSRGSSFLPGSSWRRQGAGGARSRDFQKGLVARAEAKALCICSEALFSLVPTLSFWSGQLIRGLSPGSAKFLDLVESSLAYQFLVFFDAAILSSNINWEKNI